MSAGKSKTCENEGEMAADIRSVAFFCVVEGIYRDWVRGSFPLELDCWVGGHVNEFFVPFGGESWDGRSRK